jgi:hypothetical protein
MTPSFGKSWPGMRAIVLDLREDLENRARREEGWKMHFTAALRCRRRNDSSRTEKQKRHAGPQGARVSILEC